MLRKIINNIRYNLFMIAKL